MGNEKRDLHPTCPLMAAMMLVVTTLLGCGDDDDTNYSMGLVPELLAHAAVLGEFNLQVNDAIAFVADPASEIGVTKAIAAQARVEEAAINIDLSVVSERTQGRSLQQMFVKIDFTISTAASASTEEAAVLGTQLMAIMQSLDTAALATDIESHIMNAGGRIYTIVVTSLNASTVRIVDAEGVETKIQASSSSIRATTEVNVVSISVPATTIEANRVSTTTSSADNHEESENAVEASTSTTTSSTTTSSTSTTTSSTSTTTSSTKDDAVIVDDNGVSTTASITDQEIGETTSKTTTTMTTTTMISCPCPLDKKVFITSHLGEQLEDRSGTVGIHSDLASLQEWRFTDAGSGKVFIVSHRGEQLEDRSGTVGVHSDTGDWQKWTITDAGSGNVFITSHRGKQLEDRAGTAGVHIDKGAWQRWRCDEKVECTCEAPNNPADGKNKFVCMDGSVDFCDYPALCFATGPFTKGRWSDACRDRETCTCKTPNNFANGKNKYACTDGTQGYCTSEDVCYASVPFDKGDWASGCEAKGTTCTCETPNNLGAGQNKYVCTDGAEGYCASSEVCYSSEPFRKGDWSSGCKDSATTCTCETPNDTGAGKNKYVCTDGTDGYCSSAEVCYASGSFEKGDWVSGCQNKATCTCDAPNSFDDKKNKYVCTDVTEGYCSAEEVCYASGSFEKGDWGSGCRAKGTCICVTPGNPHGGNAYECTDGNHGSCGRDEICFASGPFLKGDWTSGCTVIGTMCTCETPNDPGAGKNKYVCTDGTEDYCGSGHNGVAREVCYATASFPKGDWSSLCMKEGTTCSCDLDDGKHYPTAYKCTDGTSGACLTGYKCEPDSREIASWPKTHHPSACRECVAHRRRSSSYQRRRMSCTCYDDEMFGPCSPCYVGSGSCPVIKT